MSQLDETFMLLKSLYIKYRDTMQKNWHRDLPFNELIFDRWERARNMGFGEGSSIYHNSYVYGDVTVGENTWIGPFTLLDGSGVLSIGKYCSISAGVHIYTHDTVKWAVSGGIADYEQAPVKIGDCCHIGSQAIIIKGVNIGDHCVIGASSFVNKDIPSYTIAMGTPCMAVGKVEVDEDGNVDLIFNKKFDRK